MGPVAQSVAGVRLQIQGSRVRSRSGPIYHEIISTVLLQLIQEGLLSVTSESMCTKYCLTTLIVNLAQKKVRLVDWDVKS